MKKKKILNKKEGILFWITGLPGSGKSTIAKIIVKNIRKTYGPTIILHGDELRSIFELKGYSKKERLLNGKKFIKLIKLIIRQKINVVFAVVGLFDQLRKINKNQFNNYIEIYIKANLKTIIKFSHKKFYKKNKKKDIVGLDIKPEFPKNPNILITNSFKTTVNYLACELKKKIDKIFF